MADRKCQWCQTPLRPDANPNRKYCDLDCRRHAQNRRITPSGQYRSHRHCLVCKELFVARTSNRKYCSTACKEKMRYEKHRMKRIQAAREYRGKNKQKLNARSAEKYRRLKSEQPERWEEFCRKMSEASERRRKLNPEVYQSVQRAWRRRRAAERALSLLLIPTKQPPKV